MSARTVRSFISLALLLTACAGGGNAAATATREAEDTQLAASVAGTKQVSDSLTSTAEAIAALTEAVGQNNTATAEAINATRTHQAAEILAQRTLRAATSTAEAQPMVDLIAQLADDDFISSTNGTLTKLNDFSKTWARINWFQWDNTGHRPSNFVVKADITWESASDKANWFNSGCGWVFRVDREGENYYKIFLALDGWVRLSRSKNGSLSRIGGEYYGKLDIPKGSAVFTLVVEGDKIRAFVNGQLAFEKIDTAHSEGGLAYTINSGTNKDFGTRCIMTNIWLWEIR